MHISSMWKRVLERVKAIDTHPYPLGETALPVRLPRMHQGLPHRTFSPIAYFILFSLRYAVLLVLLVLLNLVGVF